MNKIEADKSDVCKTICLSTYSFNVYKFISRLSFQSLEAETVNKACLVICTQQIVAIGEVYVLYLSDSYIPVQNYMV